jgi:UDP-GlcNAc:undecaprenyl-phosphate GlcNAc-1-phosphate transferase
MPYYLIAFVAALVTCTALTPLARWLALRYGAVSDPGGRNVHERSIPRLGGIAIALAWGIPLLTLVIFHSACRALVGEHDRHLTGVVGGGALLCVVGALDDVRGLKAVHKLAAQVLVAAGAFALGFRIEAVFLPFVGTLEMGAFALPITVLWIVGITNAVNLIDGLDGLAAGIAFFAAFTSFVVAHLSGSVFVALTMATLMGALVGFLFFNFNPARIFMGDSGSYFLGYLLATTALAGGVQQKASTAVSLLVPVIALGLPIFDTLFSMFRRVLERRPIFSPDRGHVHHRLLELGLTHRRAVMVLYGVSVILAAGAIAVSLGRSWEVGVALFSVSAVFVGLVRFLGYFDYLHNRRRRQARIYDEKTNRLRLATRQVLPILASARSETHIFDAISRIATTCEFARVAILVDGAEVRTWSGRGGEVPRRSASNLTLPLGRDGVARAQLHFSWASTDDTTPQADVLLQLLTDVLTDALGRVGSALAPDPGVLRDEEVQSSETAERVPALSSP